MRRAEVFREEQKLYRALQEYKSAISILAPLSNNPPPAIISAQRRRDKLESRIDQKYKKLKFKMTNLMEAGKKRKALNCLERIKELIPDENDVRWKNADLLHRLLKQMISED